MVPSLPTRSLLGLVEAMYRHGETSSGDPVMHGSPPVRRRDGVPESDRERESEIARNIAAFITWVALGV